MMTASPHRSVDDALRPNLIHYATVTSACAKVGIGEIRGGMTRWHCKDRQKPGAPWGTMAHHFQLQGQRWEICLELLRQLDQALEFFER